MPFATTVSIPRQRAARRQSETQKLVLIGLAWIAAVALIVVAQIAVDDMAANTVSAANSATTQAASTQY